MKKLILISLSAFLLISCGKQSDQQNSNKSHNADATQNTTDVLSSIGVVNLDSIIERYMFAITAKESLTKKAEDAQLSINVKAKQLNTEMVDFQNKIDNNAFLSRQRAEQEAQRLQKKQMDIQQHGAMLEDDIMREQQKLDSQLKDSISLAIKEINKTKNLSLIISTNSMNDNVLYADKTLDITDEVLTLLNLRYKK